MDRKIADFCKQNKFFNAKCDSCGTLNKIPLQKLLQKKYEYKMKCKKCQKVTTIKTKSLFDTVNHI